jgi:hypothetical protein
MASVLSRTLAAALLVAPIGAAPVGAMHTPGFPMPAATPEAGRTAAWTEKRVYQVRYESTPAPVPMLAIHSWTLTVTDAEDRPVSDADISVLGGMPAHAHGLPTVPVVQPLGAGRYRVDGLKFHMPGSWIVAFRIRAAAGIDAVSFGLELP